MQSPSLKNMVKQRKLAFKNDSGQVLSRVTFDSCRALFSPTTVMLPLQKPQAQNTRFQTLSHVFLYRLYKGILNRK